MASIDLDGELRTSVLESAAARWRGQSGTQAADTPQRLARIRTRRNRMERARELRQRGLLPSKLERIIGPTMDLTALPPSEQARAAGRPVARIVERAVAGIEPRGFGTGFLVAPGLLMTNHHVLPRADLARGRGAQFLYEQSDQGTGRGVLFALDPSAFFMASKGLDYAVVAVRPVPVDGSADLGELGLIRLIEATPKIVVGDEAKIIQHPDGGPKAWAYRNNRVLAIRDDGFLHYETDTKPGSSGSPVFNEGWEVVALHHSGVPEEMPDGRLVAVDGRPWSREMGDDAIKWIANEGIRISAIVNDIKQHPPQTAEQHKLWQDLVDSTRDPLEQIDAPDAAVEIVTTHESTGDAPTELVTAAERLVRLTWRPHEDTGERRAVSKLLPPGATVTIGRHADREIVLADERVSRNHARVTIAADRLRLEDVGSANGTFLEGERISGPVDWQPGQKVRIGNFAFEAALVAAPPPDQAAADLKRGGAAPVRPAVPAGPLRVRPLTIATCHANIVDVVAPAVVVAMYAQGRPEEKGTAKALDGVLAGELATLVNADVFGRGLGQVSLLPTIGSGGISRMLAIAGLGPRSALTTEGVKLVAENVTRVLIAARLPSFAVAPIGRSSELDVGEVLKSIVVGAARALHNTSGADLFTGVQICEIDAARYQAGVTALKQLAATDFFANLLLDVTILESAPH